MQTFGFGKTGSVIQADGLNEFAFDLYKQLGQGDHNVLVSPYSLASLLIILMNGASGNTYTQFANLFHSEAQQNKIISAGLVLKNSCDGWFSCTMLHIKRGFGFDKNAPEFYSANSFWAKEDFSYKESFVDAITKDNTIAFYKVNFKTDPESVRLAINDWVKDKTRSYIKELIPKGVISQFTKLVLVNAIYFRGLWQKPFKSEKTRQMPFHLSNGQSVPVPMMQVSGTFLYTENDKLQMLQLPYTASTIEMVILLPKANNSLQVTQKNLNQIEFSRLLQMAREQHVDLDLPKFKLASTLYSLEESLQHMGLTDAFTTDANFSNLTNSPLIVSGVIQKAVLEVDEQGTVAAAATAISFAGAMPVYVPFKADHPFIFMLYDTQAHIILFLGQIMNPVRT